MSRTNPPTRSEGTKTSATSPSTTSSSPADTPVSSTETTAPRTSSTSVVSPHTGSTHGTYLNKKRLPAGEFVKVKHGDFLRFGPAEDRHFILKVEAADDEEEPAAEAQEEDQKPFGLQVNEEKAALEKYLDKQKNKTYKELYEELLSQELTPKQRKEQLNKPVYNRLEVNWGMVDEEIIYADKTDQEIIRTDILRLLPNLTLRHLSKIEDFEKKQRKLKMQIVPPVSPERLQQNRRPRR